MTETGLKRSLLPSNSGLEPPMQAYVQKIEGRQNKVAGMADIDTGAITLPELAAIVQAMIEAQRR